jgi:amino acid adenylation domain-containing protein/thioester reductase-like protein
MWLLERFHPHPSAYSVPTVIRLRGELDRDALERAIGALVERHAALRSRFPLVGEGPVCEVERHLEIPLERIEPEPGWEGECEVAVPPAVERFASQPFDLAAGPLLRVGLMEVAAADHVFALVIHHLVCDGWSLGILYSELAALYRGGVRGEAVDLAPVGVEYADHVRRERGELESGELPAGLAFWTRALEGMETLEMPYDLPRPARPSMRGALYVDHLPLSVVRRLEAIGQAHAGSLFMVLQAAFAILLHRYSGQTDIVVGTPVANRQDLDWDGLVGLLVNAVVLRTRVDDDESFEELLLRCRETTLDALEHSDVPFERVVDRLQPVRSFSRNPLFQVIFSLQGPEADLPAFEGLDATLLEPELGNAHVDLECTTWREPQRLKIRLTHSLDLFEEATARRMLGQYLRLLEQISEAPGAPVGSFDLLTEDERRGLRSRGRALDHPDLGSDLAELFDRQAERAPDALALETASRSLSYRELREASERVAASLRARGAGPESVVAVRASREAEMIVAMLGAIKSGAALLPLDPSEPASRTRHLLADAGVRMALTDDPAHAVPAAGVEWVTVAEAEAERREFERPEAAADRLAYVIYTSGSSGVPKGVLVEHRSAVNTLVGCREWFGFDEEDLFLCIASPTFDIFFFELLSPLISGAAVRLVGREELFDPSRLGSILLRATVMQAVPSLMKQVVELLEAEGTTAERMRHVFTGGDTVPARLPAAIAAAFPRARVTVLYGPTETAMVCSGVSLEDPEGVSGHPIGRPLPNVSLRVCDESGGLVPVGVAGEICIGGPGVSRGYLAPTPELAARFIELEGERFYRSGDQGRWRNDGELEFLGRLDAQLKVRGFRIEPGEIEVALESHPNVREAAVVGCGAEEARRLVAFVVLDHSEDDQRAAELRASLSESLPAHMVPASIEVVDSLPTTHNGKVDRATLEQWGATQPGDADGVGAVAREMPAGEMEGAIAEAWEGVLGISQPTRHANFFASGGTSLLAIRVAVRLKSRGIDISAEKMFRHQTIAALAAAVERPDHGREERGKGAAPPSVSPGLRVSAGGRAPTSKLTEARMVLLTGATGFLGVHLLDELLERTEAAVTCLVRGEDDSHARERLAERWAWYFGERELPADRVEVVAGDVGATALGLPSRRWRSLADNAEHVVHAAADVRHVAAEADVFRTNLEGTHNVIEFAAAGRGTSLHHVSTIGVKGVLPRVNGQLFTERDLDVGQAATEHYSASKLAAERAVREFLDSGGAGSVLRVGTIAPHSVSARFQRNGEDHFLLRYLHSTIELGLASDWPGRFFALVPVDSLATACVALADVAAPGGDTFHLTTPHRLSHCDIARMLQGLDYPIRLVDPAEFASRAWAMARDPRYDGAVGGVLGLIDPPGEHVPLDSSWTESKLRELGFEFPRPTASWFLRFVEGCIADGILPAPIQWQEVRSLPDVPLG